MSTKKGIFNTIVGVIMTIVISMFQLTFLIIIMNNTTYGLQINGLIRVIISFLSYLSLTEGGLGLITIFSLYRPLQNNDYETINDIINTTRKNYQHSGKIYLIILTTVGLIIGVASEFLPKTWSFGLNIDLPFWQIALIITSLGSRELLFFYFSGAHQNLVQADQKGYLNRLIFIFSEIIMYIILITLVVIKIDGTSIPIYIPFFAYFICGLLKVLFTAIVVKIEYPWLQHKRWTPQKRMLRQSWWVALNRLPEVIISNIDIILITIFLTLTTTSFYVIYLIIAATMRSIALILISSFREVFGYWIAKSGRIRWAVYTKFELYAYMIAAFLFINQFIISQYLVKAIGISNNELPKVNHVPNASWIFTNLFINKPWFILLFSLKNAIQVATEPGKVIVNATVKHKETIWGSYIQAFINVTLGVILGWTLSRNADFWPIALYMLILVSCLGWIYRLISIWIYVWKHLTYNSDLRYLLQNTLALILPILVTILFSCTYFFKTYPLDQSYDVAFSLKLAGYSALASMSLVMTLSMMINFKQFWSIFNLKAAFKSLFTRKQKPFLNQELQELLQEIKPKKHFNNQTFDWTGTYQSTNVNIDDFLEQELLRKEQNQKVTNDQKVHARVGIYKIRG